ncbi:chemotaxis-specific protein-glutamate methyltransferase CheB [Anaerocolumna xylanovorans]|uniref:Protein-glutamate methylesterase/protein-glutamine glutaminase n=1 Tax=Anaerocolumna xylanovorans DSM 12503 TaxID=1121345 RepID=A0A1M7YB13_9FIRM|nr:chemotaxis-specific protein-glutamate methyltransferase CheB [Anaerocolumna xylanovorans]SHO49840.1 two-component system, chemotaxis family, response regulator CheB [Anaerocolumna xylanovorans DSM 12503]
MQKKVLIVDDSALMRRVLSDIINSDPRFQVSKVAVNGLEAFLLLTQQEETYDAIILDINMPKMSGIELLEQLEQKKIKATIIIVSTVAKEGAKETIRALELGAFDFVTKPESFFEVKSDKFKDKIISCLETATKLYNLNVKEVLKEEGFIKPLIPKTPVTVDTSFPPKREIVSRNITENAINTRIPTRSGTGKKLVAIACSTGGPKALQQVIPKLSATLGCSILLVQHMPEGFTASLASRLNEISAIKVKEAEHLDGLEDNTVYIARGGYQMRFHCTDQGKDVLTVTQEAAKNGLKPCADYMYESLAESNFSEIICVVLTGMGGDGTYGIKKLKEKKNIYVIAQDEATSTVYGMPKVIKDAGLVNEVVSLEQVASAIQKSLGVQ